eukprot:TRINITY_DN12906_c0_g1_i1.p1 TRINITY_DN12906_c0_g1~~TRINITY_DN12906_c0_g1_i1.p1  ORF type:complete len:477 (+),score=190.39 TRINITY_DN12906_c0_g1_i1:102-1433(+)
MALDAARHTLAGILASGGDVPAARERYLAALGDAVKAGLPASDPLYVVGATLYGYSPEVGAAETAPPAGESVTIPFEYMQGFMKDVLLEYGVPEAEAEVASDVLIESDKRGIDSHGIGRLKPIYCDRIDKGILKPYTPVKIVKETETTAFVDGDLGLGLYVGPKCMQMAIDKAKKYGVGFVVAKNSTHYGIAGYYATMASDAGCIGFTGTNARPSIAPTYGVEPMLGTNPLCFGIPSGDDFPFCIDCATSVNQRGKIERYQREGKPTPKGCVIDNDGVERTDTEGILRDMQFGKCALTPLGGAGDELGGYKGYGWATTVELLCTAFQSGPFGEDVCGIDRETGTPKPMPLGHFFLAIDVEHICPLDTFKENTSKLLAALRAAKKSPAGPGRVYTAGELEHEARVARTANGGVPVPAPLQRDMAVLRDKFPKLAEKYQQLPFEK